MSKIDLAIRGEIVMEEGRIVGHKEHGQMLQRQVSAYAN